MTAEKMEFKTEVKELLDLMIHSLYSHKEIFLRELISNASDAIDKARYESLTNKDILANTGEWKIKIIVDKAAGTLTVSDNGIGMTHDEVIAELGTIAHSGTKDFLRALQSKALKDKPELIGQFGVGFYSSFMVADKVTRDNPKGDGDDEKGRSNGNPLPTARSSSTKRKRSGPEPMWSSISRPRTNIPGRMGDQGDHQKILRLYRPSRGHGH